MQDNESPLRGTGSLAERVASRLAAAQSPLSSPRKAAPPRPDSSAPRPVPLSRPVEPSSVEPPLAEPPVAVAAPAEPPLATSIARPQPETVSVPPAPATETPRPSSPQFNLNFKALRAAGFITADSLREGPTEEFRVIKRHLLKAAFTEERQLRDRHSNLILITSTMPNEGKTFVSINLGMIFSMERDLHVLLVDADNHRHGLSTQLGIDGRSAGLIDLLVDKSLSIPDILQRTNLPNLSVIPAGPPHPHGTELMASREMGDLMDQLATRYPDRLIFIDTPPLLASTEAVVLAAHVGHVVLVVEKDRTSKRSLQKSLEMLDGCRNLSCILNRDTSEQDYWRYGY